MKQTVWNTIVLALGISSITIPALADEGFPAGQLARVARRWDKLHAIRVVFLVVALILLVASSVIQPVFRLQNF